MTSHKIKLKRLY